MNEITYKRPKRKLSFCCALWIVVVVVAMAVYSTLSVRFANRVRLFRAEIEIGMNEMDVIMRLGNPSIVDFNYRMSDGRVYHFVYYSGEIFLRKSIFLYFDAETKKLVLKDRAYGPGAHHAQ